ncbi:MAG TPA: hypothetical protein VK957_12365, partial [Lunatimonas sp.]|nr:hypothetical protein [Lunatimonas sp.]
STANNTHAAYYSVPAKYLQRSLPEATEDENKPPFQIQSIQKIDGHYDGHALTPNLRQVDVVGGFTSAAGINFYTARDYPKEYWNRIAFVNEPTIRLTHNAIIEPSGAGFAEKDGWNLLASSDEWFGPVYSAVGPDGAVWVADWYNFIIQHNVFVERQAPSRMVLPFEDQPHGQGNAFHSELRDTNHGRIYRVIYKDAKKNAPMALSKDDPDGLVDALSHSNMFWRMTAQRLLVESNNKAVVPDLIGIINDKSVDEIGLNGPAVHAIWTLHGMGELEENNAQAIKAVREALRHPAAGVKKAALATLPKTDLTLNAIQQAGLTNDPNLNVRMHTFLELANMPTSPEVGQMLAEAANIKENAQDDWLIKALFAATSVHSEAFTAHASKAGHTSGLLARLLTGVATERYELGRRNQLQYSPDLTDKEIRIKANISGRRNENPFGVILAHGNRQSGYSLYIKDGQLIFDLIQEGKSTTLSSKGKELPDTFDVKISLERDGKLSLYVNEELYGSASAVPLFKSPVFPSVRSGRDLGGEDNVASYEKDFPFEGNLQGLVLELN